jgi:hypothetical protein
MSEWKPIASFSDVRRGASPRPISDPKYFGGNVGWVRIVDVTRSSRFLRETEQYLSPLGESCSVRVDPGDVVMSICGTLGRPIIIDMAACIHDGFVQFQNLRGITADFLFYTLQYSEPAFNGMGQPGTQNNLNTSLVGKHKIFCPAIEQQHRIAEILSTVDEAIEQTEALIAKTQQIKAGLMHDLFIRGVTPNGELRPPREEAPHLYKDSPIGWIPKEWEVRMLDRMTTLMTNGFVGTATPYYSTAAYSVRYLYGNNVRPNRLDMSDALSVSRDFHERQGKSQLRPGDMLTVQSGHIGTSAVVPEGFGEANCHALIISRGWQIIDQGPDIPADPAKSRRRSFRQWILPEVFAAAVSAINTTADGKPWLTQRQIQDLLDQILRQPNRTLLEANEAVQKLLLKAQVDLNEVTGEQDPVVKLIDFANPENNHFLVINQFRIDTPGCVKQFIILDIVLFVNGIPLIVVECKKGGPTCANPMAPAFEQLQRYMNRREETKQQGLREGEPRLFHCNLFVVRTCGVEADYGTITSGDEHFYPWKTQWPQPEINADETAAGMDQQAQLINGMLNKPNLLSMLRTSSVFMDTDAGPRIKVVCRYQQFRAANKIVQRLRDGATPAERSGVVWHTQGSGKSLTMVFVARMLRASRDLGDFKIILINDRATWRSSSRRPRP